MERKGFRFIERLVSSFIVGYNKSVVLHTVTVNTMQIIQRKVQTVRDRLETIVATFEEIRATSQNTAKNTKGIGKQVDSITQRNQDLSEDLDQRIEEIKEVDQESVAMEKIFEELTQKAEKVSQISSDIQDVSERTNVLAINASIEAARAGEAGKGFRVIAGEVKSLASQTNEFAEDISVTMEEFDKTTANAAEYVIRFSRVMRELRESIQEIKQNFNQTNKEQESTGNAISEITAAVEEQDAAIQEGLTALEQTFNSLQDSHNVSQALRLAYTNIGKILEKAQ